MMESKTRRHDEGGKDYNAKAMIHRNIQQHNGYTEMENETTLKKLDRSSSRNSKHEDSGRPQQSYDYKEAINEMFYSDIDEPSPIIP